ncbi:MAG: sodium-dependent transporter [Gemmatimonadota bacterium]
MTTQRERWRSRAGFLLATVGAAVGLGNMWRFPYLTAENGGAAFVVLYLVMTAAIGLPIMLAELAVGRGAHKGPVEALVHFGGARWRPLGYLFVATGTLVLAYYSVVAGWILRTTFEGLTEGFRVDAAARFDRISSGTGTVVSHLVFLALVVAIGSAGVRRGIERTATLLMPALFVILIGLAAYAATLSGAGAGYGFYLRVSFRDLLSLDVLAAAAAQAFFSLSVGMGALITLASYMGDGGDLPRESVIVAGSDFLVAFVAGLIVFPLLFALGLSSGIGEDSIGALFIGLPQAFGQMTAGRTVGTAFFVLLLFGAFTSAIVMLEVVGAGVMEGLGRPRRTVLPVLGGFIALLGIPAALDVRILALADQVAAHVLLVTGALVFALFAGWAMPGAMEEAGRGARGARWLPGWRFFLRYVAAPVLLILLVESVRDTVRMAAGLFGGGG